MTTAGGRVFGFVAAYSAALDLPLRRIWGTVALAAMFMAGVAVGAGAVAALEGDGAHSPSGQVAPPVSNSAAQPSPSGPVTASPSNKPAPSRSAPVTSSPSNRVDITGQVNGSTVFTAGSAFDEPCSGGDQVQVSNGASTTLRVAKTRLVSQHDTREGKVVTRQCKTTYRVNVPAADVYRVSLQASIKNLTELNARGTWETTFNGGVAPPLYYVYALY
jgi:hypothetical protein